MDHRSVVPHIYVTSRNGREGGPVKRVTSSDSHAEVMPRTLGSMTPDDQMRDPREEARAQIREFLSTRRARVSPEQAGLPHYGGDRRRVAGLRREEVAVLAGVSPQYYIRLERGDATGVSDSIIDGVARALQLDAAERGHLRDLLRTAATPRRPSRRTPARPMPVRPSVQRLMDAMHDAPAVVMNGRLDIVASNALGRALFSPLFDDQGPAPSNPMFVFLSPAAKTFYRHWETVANDTVAVLRAEAGRDPHDRDLSDLVGQLSTRSDDFRVRWAAHDVRIHATGEKGFHHPVVGDLDLVYETLPIDAVTTMNLIAYTAEHGSKAQAALNLLASWTASDPATPDRIGPTDISASPNRPPT
jgi:transcriptional regulator with XRE-family HTH domain